MNRRVVSLLATVGLAAGLVTASAGGAAAYPPGKALTLTASPSIVTANAHLWAIARNVGPGCRVTFVLGARSITVSSSNGVAGVVFQAPPAPGPRTISAATSGCSYLERAYTRIVVTGPVVNAPAAVRRYHVFAINVARFYGRSLVTLKLTSGRSVIVQRRVTNPYGSTTMWFRMARTGTYLITAIQGHIYATKVLRVVN
jgi:hypothetical protein